MAPPPPVVFVSPSKVRPPDPSKRRRTRLPVPVPLMACRRLNGDASHIGRSVNMSTAFLTYCVGLVRSYNGRNRETHEMATTGWNRRLLASTRGRILSVLRRGGVTVNELADATGLTDNAVRAQLTALER